MIKKIKILKIDYDKKRNLSLINVEVIDDHKNITLAIKSNDLVCCLLKKNLKKVYEENILQRHQMLIGKVVNWDSSHVVSMNGKRKTDLELENIEKEFFDFPFTEILDMENYPYEDIYETEEK